MSDFRVVLISSYPPRRCGIATFSHDLGRALAHEPGVDVKVIAIEPPGETHAYGANVIGRVCQDEPQSYIDAVKIAARAGADIISLQHEFGLWGVWGSTGLEQDYAALTLRAAAAMPKPIPVVTTLHTIRPNPEPSVQAAMTTIVRESAATVVMARTGAMILVDDYQLPAESFVRISHGVPVVEAKPRPYFKARLGFEGRTLISTFGLLDPRKGIEYMIRAMKRVVERHPEALYLVAGETHPELRKKSGEKYRNQLLSLTRMLRLHDHIRFINQYLTDQQIIDYLQASDIYVTPYLDRHQITSGTLAFAVGTGRAIISTPYPHATEALAEGRGLLAEFRSADSLHQCLQLMLDRPDARRAWEERTREYGKQDGWPRVAERYMRLFRRVARGLPFPDMRAIHVESLPQTIWTEPEPGRLPMGASA
jgi:glycosyltransferase involved in cell wall biosynthesis